MFLEANKLLLMSSTYRRIIDQPIVLADFKFDHPTARSRNLPKRDTVFTYNIMNR